MGKMTKKDLLALITAYDQYIQSANDENRYAEGWFPVCINEFRDCEFREAASQQ